MPRKLVLAVIDGLHPAALEQALAAGSVPALAAIAARATVRGSSAAAFPSVTPVCAATIATGARQDRHHIPGMNWFRRAEDRYVEYGSSMAAARVFGIQRQLVDLVYRMNDRHLSATTPTVFEQLDDAGVRTAGTTFLMYRGRHRHEMARDLPLSLVARRLFGDRPVLGPAEFFYADLFASRETGCRSAFGRPGLRDRHTGCVGAHLVEQDLFDFLLFSLPDNDAHSHRTGPRGQAETVVAADAELMRLMAAGGGPDAFLDEHAVIVAADHAHADVHVGVGLVEAFAGHGVLMPGRRPLRRRSDPAHIAVCPSQRSGQLYVLDPDRRDLLLPGLRATARRVPGVDLMMWRTSDGAGIASAAGELRFAPGADVLDARGVGWAVDGDPAVLQARVEDGRLRTSVYPDALARVWAAVTCPTSGDLLLSATPGFEFRDWGGQDHVGGGSHGSLHHDDSLGALLACGVEPPAARAADGAWSIVDLCGMATAHFGVA